MPAMVRAEPIQRQEPEASSGSPTWVQRHTESLKSVAQNAEFTDSGAAGARAIQRSEDNVRAGPGTEAHGVSVTRAELTLVLTL